MQDESHTVFDGSRIAFSGSPPEAIRIAREKLGQDPGRQIFVFNDATGRLVDVDLRPEAPAAVTETAPRRGRPKLGVVAREVTLLPRHWEWLAAQPGGASVALRRLVDQARKGDGVAAARRDAAYRFMHAMAGDRPGFEEAVRALYAGDLSRLAAFTASWPRDIATYARRLASPGDDAPG
jgi:hypothetical protein